jgi:TolA-binding protein
MSSRLLATLLLGLTACSGSSPRSRYVLAEKLWSEGRYEAAAQEFDRVAARDPKGEVGSQAEFRSGMTLTLFLNRHREAAERFKRFVERVGPGPTTWEAQRQIGEILFSRLERFSDAAGHYSALLENPDYKTLGTESERAEFKFRIARSYFLTYRFADAIKAYERLRREHATAPISERALYEIGMCFFTRGEGEDFQDAIDWFKRFQLAYPRSPFVSEARFGIASALEELDQLDAALSQYEALAKEYPSPNVIKIKVHRLKQRLAQKRR